VLPDRFAVYQLAAADPVPPWAGGAFVSVTRTVDELSVVCAEGLAPAGTACQPGWRFFQVEGPLDFSLTGILAPIASPLAAAGVSIFALSTFDTDYVMVQDAGLAKAIDALRAEGHRVTP